MGNCQGKGMGKGKELNTMFNTNELRSLEEAIENYGSRCSGNEWRELLAKVRRERFDSQINPFVDDDGNRIEELI